MYIHCYISSRNMFKIILCILTLKSSLLKFYHKLKIFYVQIESECRKYNYVQYMVKLPKQIIHFYFMALFSPYLGKLYNHSGVQLFPDEYTHNALNFLHCLWKCAIRVPWKHTTASLSVVYWEALRFNFDLFPHTPRFSPLAQTEFLPLIAKEILNILLTAESVVKFPF